MVTILLAQMWDIYVVNWKLINIIKKYNNILSATSLIFSNNNNNSNDDDNDNDGDTNSSISNNNNNNDNNNNSKKLGSCSLRFS